MTASKIYWIGEIAVCDYCRGPFRGDVMYDANLGIAWGNVCERCFKMLDCKLGVGFGQKYELQKNGRWLQVAGRKTDILEDDPRPQIDEIPSLEDDEK